MDREKTGALIASARKERGLTQKELAAQLHVSDRAVSKWERGAGFPDISLLEPWADALGVQVLDLLRGEETEAPEPEMTVRRAIVLLVRQTREKTRRRWGQILGGLFAALLVGFVLFAILDRAGVFLRDVSLTATATVYTADGAPAGETTVTIDGTRKVVGEKSFFGKFAIGLCGAYLPGGGNGPYPLGLPGSRGLAGHSLFPGRGVFVPGRGTDAVYHGKYAVLRTEAGGRRIIATDPEYVPLLASEYYYSIRPVFGMHS